MKITQATTTQRDQIANPSGMLIFNTTTNAFEKHNGTSWDTFNAGASIGTSTIAITGAGTTTIPTTSDLTRAIYIDVQSNATFTHTIVLPSQSYNVYFHLQFKFLQSSQNVTVLINTANSTTITTLTGNPISGINSYPKLEYVGNGNNYSANMFVSPSALGTNLMYAPTATAAKSILGLSNAVLSNNIFDSVGEVNPNLLPVFVSEDFMQSGTGTVIQMTSSVGGGGSLSTEIPESQPNWNSGIPKPRFGQASLRIALLTSAISTLRTNFNFRFLSGGAFTCGAEWSIVGGQVDFGLDPTLLAVGFFDAFTSTNPAIGVYFRPPRVGETSFLRYVIRIGSTEVLNQPTSIVYDSTSRRFIKTQIMWNGTDLLFQSTDGVNISNNTVTNISTSYPSLLTTNFGFGGYNARSGVGVSLISRNLNIDKLYYYFQTNYINF